MNQFDVFEFGNLLQLLTSLCERYERSKDGASVNVSSLEDSIFQLLGRVREYCKSVGFVSCQTRINEGLASARRSTVGGARLAVLATELEHAREALLNEAKDRYFVLLSLDRAAFIDKKQLFGKEVYELFPSARSDIRDVGSSLAAECDTAAVFHLMRVAEHGLRYLAKRLHVRAVKSHGTLCPLEYADWGAVVGAIQIKLTAARKLTNGKKRIEQVELYSDAADHCGFMKDIWRNTTSHTRKPYSPEEALAALGRVKEFMIFLARTLRKR